MKVLLDTFDEHDGPVRGVDFHKVQPLFVTGGDDYKIKIWNHKVRRCLFTLLGHLDYIRTVSFHNEHPWIVSASDDQTIRIWNWQSRSCIAVLTGHNHYVMCASFHPTDDLVVSASLDQSVRVWDTAGLRKKTVHGIPDMDGPPMNGPPTSNGIGSKVSSRVNAELFGAGDAVVKYILEGHDRGVNWASFHPTLPLVISGADDRQVKLWRMNETKAWEVDTMRGHTNNVSSALFHPKEELIISNSEDRSIRVWDISKRLAVFTYRKEHDRFWILSAHPTKNLLAAGHDSGMMVFKLQRERPAYASRDRQLMYVKDRYLRIYDFPSKRDVPVVNLRRSTSASILGSKPYSLQINALNQAENNVIVWSTMEGGTYELVTFPKNGAGSGEIEPRKGSGMAAVFVARNRIAVLDKSNNILIKNLHNDLTKRFSTPEQGIDGMFFAGTSGRIILRKEDKLLLFENNSRKVLAQVQAPKVKYCIWNNDYTMVAFLSKNNITICDKQLRLLCQVTEAVKVKSGEWDENNIFIYSTTTHIKYTLSNGDNGLIRTMNRCIYATKVFRGVLFCLDREWKPRALKLDMTEALFKLALIKERYRDVMRIVRKSHMCGQAILAYLTKKGFPQVALYFVKDEKTRFELALECGDIKVATESAKAVDDLECWEKLGVAALQQGKHEVVELSYQRAKNFERLSFLYLITGNIPYLQKMLKISQMRNDVMSRFHNALYLGDVEERVRILEEVGQLSLAYLLAESHGFTEDATRLKQRLESAEAPVPDASNVQLLMPPTPISRACTNWPEIAVRDDVFAAAVKGKDDEEDTPDAEQVWDEEDSQNKSNMSNGLDDDSDLDMEADNWGAGSGDDDDDDLFGDDDDDAFGSDIDDGDGGNDDGMDANGIYVAPNPGKKASVSWVDNSSLAGDHAAAGSFTTAMKLLNRQIGIVNFKPLRNAFLSVYQGNSASMPMSIGGPPPSNFFLRSGDTGSNNSLPRVAIRLENLTRDIKSGYKAFVAGKFSDAKNIFLSVLHKAPLVVVSSRAEEREVKELLAICREYILATTITQKRKETKDPKRGLELASYLTHCDLQSKHTLLALKLAMTQAYKSKNYVTAESFARRLLDLNPNNAKMISNAKKVVQMSQKEGRNAMKISYNPQDNFLICAGSFIPLPRGREPLPISCPYCGASYDPKFMGTICTVCNLAKVGTETVGLVVYNAEV